MGDTLDITYKHGKIQVEKVDESWDDVMKETRGTWGEHPVFKDKKDAVEIVNWMRGKK